MMNLFVKRVLFVTLALSLVAGTLFFIWRPSERLPTNQLKIGILVAKTGYAAAFGQAEVNAVEILKTRYPNVHFVVEDNGSDPKTGVIGARRLIDTQNVDIIYCDLTDVTNAFLPVARDHRKVVIASVYLQDLLKRSALAIRSLPTATDEALIILTHLKEHQPVALQRIAALGSNDEFGRSSLEDFRVAASSASGTLIFEDLIPAEEQQIAAFAQKVIAQAPAAVYAASLQPNLGFLIRELRRGGFDGPILTTDAFAYPYIRDAAGRASKGVLFVDFPDTAAKADFNAQYLERFKSPSNPTAALIYDSLSMAIDAWNRSTKPVAPDALIAAIDGSSFDGLNGRIQVKNREMKYLMKLRTSE